MEAANMYIDPQASRQNDSTMSMRWESKDFLSQLWMNLAYKERKRVNGIISLKNIYSDEVDIEPLLNVQGASHIINMIQSTINPVVSLSNITLDQAMFLFKHIKESVARALVIEGDRWGCTRRAQKRQVLQIVENVVLPQLMRAVSGHESKNSSTQILEKVEQGTYTQETRGGGIFGRKNNHSGGYGQ